MNTPELSNKNHFEFGYNSQPFTFRQSVDDKWFVRYGKCHQIPLNFKDECVRTARLIRNKTTLPIQVMFSGGVDSEVVIRSFNAAKIPIEAAIMRFKNDLNVHDISWAVITCEELEIPYRFYDLDILDFWNTNPFKFSDPTYCISPQLLSTMWLVDQLEGYPVLGSGECLFIRRDAPMPGAPDPNDYDSTTEWDLYEKEKIAAWYRHFMIRGRDGCPGFFQFTPEIILSFMLDPYVRKLCSNKVYKKYSSASSKLMIYQNHFSEIKSRPKYTGFEKVQDADALLRKILTERYPGCGQIELSSYKSLLKNLEPEIIATARELDGSI